MKKGSNFVRVMGILEIIAAVVLFFASIYAMDKDIDFKSMLEEAGSEAKVMGLAIYINPAIRIIAGLVAAIGKGRPKGLVVFLGILIVATSGTIAKATAFMKPFSIAGLVIACVYLIAAICYKKEDAE